MWVLTQEYELVNLNYYPRVLQSEVPGGQVQVIARRYVSVYYEHGGAPVVEDVRLLPSVDTNVAGDLIDALMKSLELRAASFSIPDWLDRPANKGRKKT